MVDISFLNIIPPLQLRSGMEYLEWQKTTFFDELTAVIKTAYDPNTLQLKLDKFNRSLIEQCIKRNTNITTTIKVEEGTQFAIDAGFISPNSVLNNTGLDKVFRKEHTNVYQLFKELNTDVIKGYCDLTTGKVEGEFKSIPFILFIGEDVRSILKNKKFIASQGVTPEQVIAAIILHECGHAFFGLHYLSTAVVDNTIMMQSIKMLLDEPDKNRKVKIIRDVEKVLDVDLANTNIEDKASSEEIVILFEKGLANRDYRRTLSLGVTDMTSEVLADIYCARMGGARANGVAVSVFNSGNKLLPKFISAIFRITLLYLFAPVVITTIFSTFISFGLLIALANKLMPTIYDTPYRRLKALLRDQIAYLNSKNNNLSPLDTKRMIEDAKTLDALLEKQKTFWEGTAVQRLVGWIFRGNDFRKTDVENYTADLVNSRLALSTL